MNRAVSLALFALALLAPKTALAQRWSVSAGVAGDLSLAPDPRGFGIVVADLRVRGIARGGDLRATLNTDTLQVGIESVALSPRVQLGAFARGQALFGGMLPTYIQRGERVAARGFFASYVQLAASVKWLPADHHALELVLSGRRWFFTGGDGVDALPPAPFTFEPRIRYVFWDLQLPRGDLDAGIFHPRFHGVALGLELGMDLRSEQGSYGPRAGGARTGTITPRPLMVRQWLRAGVRAHPRLRVQFEESASFGVDEDDLTRPRVGGMNPWSVQVPGLPWPALLSERLIAAMVSAHWQPSSRYAHELGIAFAAGAFSDPARTGDLDRFGALGGAALFTDLRWSAWTLHLRAGAALPSEWLDRAPHLGAFASLSRRWN